MGAAEAQGTEHNSEGRGLMWARYSTRAPDRSVKVPGRASTSWATNPMIQNRQG